MSENYIGQTSKKMNETTIGTLNDAEIKRLGHSHQLIIENFDDKNVKQACYELRAGTEYFILNGTKSEKKQLTRNEEIVFRPHQTIVVISKEKFSIPNDILARFLTKGSLFSVGFVPVNTYADPGFEGYMGIVITNASNNYLKIKNGEVISKVEFNRLQNPVEYPYHGQHGYDTGIWPLKQEFIMPLDEVKRKIPNYDELTEIEIAYGAAVANRLRVLFVYGRRFLIVSIIIIILNMALISFAVKTDLSYLFSIIAGVLSNLIFLGIEHFLHKGRINQ